MVFLPVCGETASYLPKSVSSPSQHSARTHFPVALTVWCGQIIFIVNGIWGEVTFSYTVLSLPKAWHKKSPTHVLPHSPHFLLTLKDICQKWQSLLAWCPECLSGTDCLPLTWTTLRCPNCRKWEVSVIWRHYMLGLFVTAVSHTLIHCWVRINATSSWKMRAQWN